MRRKTCNRFNFLSKVRDHKEIIGLYINFRTGKQTKSCFRLRSRFRLLQLSTCMCRQCAFHIFIHNFSIQTAFKNAFSTRKGIFESSVNGHGIFVCCCKDISFCHFAKSFGRFIFLKRLRDFS